MSIINITPAYDAVLGTDPRPATAAGTCDGPGVASRRLPARYSAASFTGAGALAERIAGPGAWRGTIGALAALLLRGGLEARIAIVLCHRSLRVYDVRADGIPGNCIAIVEVRR